MNRRRFLTAKEVQAMMQAARQGPTGERDYCLILLAFRHGMRISELLDLHYHDLDLHEGRVNVRRLKNGFRRFIHCVLMSARRLSAGARSVPAGKRRTKRTHCLSPPRTALSRQQAYRIIRSAGENAGTVTHTHPHMLRHACGYELAERGTDTRLIQDYLGHRNIRHTVRYTASNAARFAGIWERNNLLEEKTRRRKMK